MYLSIWFGIMLAGQSGCSTQKAEKPDKLAQEEARKALPFEEKVNPLVKRLNNPSTMPVVPPAGVRTSYSSVNISQKALAMTFDDGPHPSLTPKLLDLLKARNIKCTFFVLGSNAKAYPAIIRRMFAEGHEIANHTYSHRSLTSLSDEQIRKELKDTDDAVFAAAGVHPRLMRPPYGAINARIKDLVFTEFGYPTIMWSVDPQDWRRPGVGAVTSRLVSGARPGAIMLSHDIHSSTIAAMPEVFDQLLAKGYQFVTVSQLLNMEKSSMPVGVIIRPAESVGDLDPKPLPQKRPSA
jgi:peptidoglycan/xylan/chitin deacetylase (PgdA/CDA1 family)